MTADAQKPGRVARTSGERKEFHAPGAQQPLSPKAYAVISLLGLVLGIGLLVFYIYQVPRLVQNGIANLVFYVLLIPWGLACAAFLFGTLRSYAFYAHRHLGNVLELGGPVVLFCLVVVGGFRLVPQPPATFDLTVRPYGEDGAAPIIRSGEIVIDLGNDRREASIGPNGEANFKGIPGRFKETVIKVLPLVEGYKQQWQQHKVSENVLELPLERDSNLVMDSNPASLGVLSPNQGHTDRSPSVQAAQINKLIAQEAEFALGSHDPESAEKYANLFYADGSIEDYGPPSQTWQGRARIIQRFLELPRFKTLDHKRSGAPVLLDDSAFVQARTTFVLEKPKPNENTVGAGNESWTFGKVEGKWKIRSFRYNVPDKEP